MNSRTGTFNLSKRLNDYATVSEVVAMQNEATKRIRDFIEREFEKEREARASLPWYKRIFS